MLLEKLEATLLKCDSTYSLSVYKSIQGLCVLSSCQSTGQVLLSPGKGRLLLFHSERGDRDGPQLDSLPRLGTMLGRDAERGMQKIHSAD